MNNRTLRLTDSTFRGQRLKLLLAEAGDAAFGDQNMLADLDRTVSFCTSWIALRFMRIVSGYQLAPDVVAPRSRS